MSYFSGQAMRILGFKPASLIIKGQDFAIPFSNDSGERRGRDETWITAMGAGWRGWSRLLLGVSAWL